MEPDRPGGANGASNAPLLRYVVSTLDGEPLLPAGTRLDAALLRELAGRDRTPWPRMALLDYGSVRSDLSAFIAANTAYRNIFSEDKLARESRALMAAVTLPLPVLECLSYFRTEDFYTYRHMLTVFALFSLLGHDMADETGASALEVAAGPLHDLGKICVPLATLTKRTPLTHDERSLVEHHAVAGYVLLAYYMRRPDAFSARVARDHHERRDGSGYPLGIRLDDPQVELVAICDIYDALINPRPYRKSDFDNRTALEVITELAETGRIGWDPVRRLVAANRKDRPPPDACVVSPEKRGKPPAENSYGVIAREQPAGSR